MSFIYQPAKYIFKSDLVSLKAEPIFAKLAFIFFAWWIIKELKREKINMQFKELFWFLFSIIFGSLAGGRLWYYITHWKGPESLLIMFDLSKEGLTSHGMVIGGILSAMLFAYFYNQKRKIAKNWKSLFVKYIDIIALASGLFIFIFRMGCFHDGHIPGTQTSLPWGMFTLHYGIYTGYILHPIALYLSFQGLILFLFLNWYKTRKKFDGEVGLLFLLLYSFSRFWLEFMVSDSKPYFGLNFGQVVLLITFFISLFLYLKYVFFVRDPPRNLSKNAKIVSPSDGKILYVKEVHNGKVPVSIKDKQKIELEEILKLDIPFKKGILVGIYLSFMDVHYQRSPISGEIKNIWYHRSGTNRSFFKLFLRKIFNLKPYDKNSRHILENERNVIHIKNDKFDCFVVQIAEKVFKRIECFVDVGSKVLIGDKIGIIKMGSQVDLFIPNIKKSQFRLKIGKKVKAGEFKIL